MRSRRFRPSVEHIHTDPFSEADLRDGARQSHLRSDHCRVWPPAPHRGNHAGAHRALHVDWRSARLSRLYESGVLHPQGHADSDSGRCAAADHRSGRRQGLAGGEERGDGLRASSDGDALPLSASLRAVSNCATRMEHRAPHPRRAPRDHRARGRPLDKSLRAMSKTPRMRFCSRSIGPRPRRGKSTMSATSACSLCVRSSR